MCIRDRVIMAIVVLALVIAVMCKCKNKKYREAIYDNAVDLTMMEEDSCSNNMMLKGNAAYGIIPYAENAARKEGESYVI